MDVDATFLMLRRLSKLRKDDELLELVRGRIHAPIQKNYLLGETSRVLCLAPEWVLSSVPGLGAQTTEYVCHAHPARTLRSASATLRFLPNRLLILMYFPLNPIQ